MCGTKTALAVIVLVALSTVAFAQQFSLQELSIGDNSEAAEAGLAAKPKPDDIFADILRALLNILEQMQAIAAKNTTVNVNPILNVSTPQPNVVVNNNVPVPNVTINTQGVKECQWEKRVYSIDVFYVEAETCKATDILFPLEAYKEVKIDRIRFLLYLHNVSYQSWLDATRRDIFVGKYIDNMTQLGYVPTQPFSHKGGTVGRDISVFLEVTNPESLKDGASIIQACYTNTVGRMNIINMQIEYEIEPANC